MQAGFISHRVLVCFFKCTMCSSMCPDIVTSLHCDLSAAIFCYVPSTCIGLIYHNSEFCKQSSPPGVHVDGCYGEGSEKQQP